MAQDTKAMTDFAAAQEEAEASGLICAYLLDGQGRGQALDWPAVRAWTPDQGTLWIHLNRKRQGAQTYLREEARVDQFVVDALLAEDTRPRTVRQGEGFLVNLRGLNFNPGAEPEDMISLRSFVEKRRIITTRQRRLMAVDDIVREMNAGRGPRDELECLFRLAALLLHRVGRVVEELEEALDTLEDQVIQHKMGRARDELAQLRRRAITIRRHLVPQRDAMMRLEYEQAEMFDATDAARFRELADETQRYIEDLDSARERAIVIQDEISTRLNERQSRHAYTLSVVAAIMLPLSFITSLFGVSFKNVPLSDDPQAFWTLIAVLAALAAFQIILFRLMRWF